MKSIYLFIFYLCCVVLSCVVLYFFICILVRHFSFFYCSTFLCIHMAHINFTLIIVIDLGEVFIL